MIRIANCLHVKPLSVVCLARVAWLGGLGLGLSDVVRQVVQVVAQEMYLEK